MEPTPLRLARRRRGLTLQKVAIAIETDVGNLSRIETGRQRPSPKLAEKLALMFHPDLSEMEVIYPERYTLRRAA